MGNENSRDGEDGEQQEGEEGPSGSEKDPAKSQLPNGDVGTSSSGRPGDPTPEGEEGDPRESSEVDEHTKRMTIISENVYHYVGVVAGREYAREKGLTPTEGDLPVAPIGFMRPNKKKKDTEMKPASDPGKPPIGKEKPEAGKESPAMELPHFFQSPTDDKDRETDKSSKTSDAPDGKAKDEIMHENDGKEKVGKLDSKPEKEVGSVETGLPRFYQSQGTDEAKQAPAESGKVTDMPTGKVESKTTEKDGEQKVEKKESTPGKDVKLQETELYQSDKNKTIDETGKSDIPAVPPGKTGDKTDEKDKKVGKPTKGSLESKPEQEAHTPATKIPRFYQPSNEDKKNGRGEPGKSETKDISNGTPEGNARDKGDKTEATETKLPRLYQSPSQDKTKAAGEIDKSDTQSVPNGDAKTKTDQKDNKQENKSEKEIQIEMPRFYSADGNEVKSDTDPDLTGERYTTALTVGPRSGKTEEPKKRQSVTINFLPAGSRKSLEEELEDTEETLEQDVVEAAVVQKEKAETSHEKSNLGSLESTKEPEVEVTQSKSGEKKEKNVRFDDSIAENETPSNPETKRVTSMVYVTPSGNTKSQEPVWFAAPVELASTPPQTSADEPRTSDEEDTHEGDPVPITCGEELRQDDKRLKRDLQVDDDGYFEENMACDDPEEGVKQPQKNNTTTVVILNLGKDTKTNTEHHDDPDAADDIITPKAATSLNSSSAVVVLSQGSPKRVPDVEEGAPDYDVHHMEQQPVPRSPEVDLGSGKILNAPSILMGSSITLSSNRQKCEVLPQDTSDGGGAVRVKTKPAALREVRIEPSRIAVRLRPSGGTLSQGDSIDSKRATITDDVDASVAPLAASTQDSGNSKCDNYTQTSDVARKAERTAAPLVLRSRSVGFQCGAGAGDPKRTIATQKRPSLSSDPRSTKPLETEKKTRIPLVARSAHHPETKSVHPEVRSPQTEARPVQTLEARRGKGSPLPERKISVLRKDATTNKSSPRTPPATSDSRNHKELAKRVSLPVRDSPTCSGHPVTPRTIPASPRVVRKRDDSKSAMHKTSASSKSMDSIPRCTCLQVAGKDSPHGDKTVARQLSNPLGLREYDFNPPSKRPHWR